jgi:hypothetical protein
MSDQDQDPLAVVTALITLYQKLPEQTAANFADLMKAINQLVPSQETKSEMSKGELESIDVNSLFEEIGRLQDQRIGYWSAIAGILFGFTSLAVIDAFHIYYSVSIFCIILTGLSLYIGGREALFDDDRTEIKNRSMEKGYKGHEARRAEMKNARPAPQNLKQRIQFMAMSSAHNKAMKFVMGTLILIAALYLEIRWFFDFKGPLLLVGMIVTIMIHGLCIFLVQLWIPD